MKEHTQRAPGRADLQESTHPALPRRDHRWLRRAGLVVLLLLCVTALVLRFGGWILVKSDPLPAHAQVAVMLDGPAVGVIARYATALRFLQTGKVDYVMLSVGKVRLWGEYVPEVARRYVERNYGQEIAKRVVVCEMNTDSTFQEALALRACLQDQGWKSILVVTSDYHTRRARRIWRKVLGAQTTLSVYGVRDGDFDAQGWWTSRRSAKTWLLETTKLAWNLLTGN